MSPKPPRKRDDNQAAADTVRRTTSKKADELPPDVEAAWQDWAGRIHGCDERTMTLLRAAFEAGADAARRVSAASELGTLGASKGGNARAAVLSATKRRLIAKRAAAARWRKHKQAE